MTRFFSKVLFYLGAFTTCTMMAFGSGCASGGYKLTREYARWVNSQNIILRIIIYIFTMVVFAITLLIDTVVFNTIDFWEGRVSQGTYEFKDDNKTFIVRHEVAPETLLKRSTVQVRDENQKLLQEVVLSQTVTGEIEMYVDGKLRTKVTDINAIPVASIYDEKGQVTESKYIWFTPGADQAIAQH